MGQIVPGDAGTTPWEEAVREAVQEQDKKRMRLHEERHKAAAEEEIMQMIEAEQARMAEAEQKVKKTSLQLSRKYVSKFERGLLMYDWLDREERKAYELEDPAAIRRLPAVSQIHVRLHKIQYSVISQTQEIIELLGTWQRGKWAQDPATVSQLIEQTAKYCRPTRAFEPKWSEIISSKHRHIMLHTIERGFRIGSQAWNEAFEAYFHRSVQLSMAMDHKQFITSPELQITAIELERQFDEHAASLRRKRPSTIIPSTMISNKKWFFRGRFPSRTHQSREIRAGLPSNPVLTGQLWMTEQRKPGMVVAGMLTSPTRLPT